MIKNLIYIIIAIIVIVIVIGFSDRFKKIAEKHDRSQVGGTGTDVYFSCSVFTVLISVGVIIYNGAQVIIFLS